MTDLFILYNNIKYTVHFCLRDSILRISKGMASIKRYVIVWIWM